MPKEESPKKNQQHGAKKLEGEKHGKETWTPSSEDNRKKYEIEKLSSHDGNPQELIAPPASPGAAFLQKGRPLSPEKENHKSIAVQQRDCTLGMIAKIEQNRPSALQRQWEHGQVGPSTSTQTWRSTRDTHDKKSNNIHVDREERQVFPGAVPYPVRLHKSHSPSQGKDHHQNITAQQRNRPLGMFAKMEQHSPSTPQRQKEYDKAGPSATPQTLKSARAVHDEMSTNIHDHEEDHQILPGAIPMTGMLGIERSESAISMHDPAANVSENNYSSGVSSAQVKDPCSDTLQRRSSEVLISAFLVEEDPEHGTAPIVKAEPLRGSFWKRAIPGLLVLCLISGVIALVLVRKTDPKHIDTFAEEEFEPFVTVSLQLDEEPSQIGWQLSCNEEIVANQSVGSYRSTFQHDQQSFVVEEGSVCTFRIEDSQGDGLCCNNGTGYYRVHVGADISDPSSIRAEGSEFGHEEISRFTVTRPWRELGAFAGNQRNSYRGFSLALSADGMTMATGSPGLVGFKLGNTDIGEVQVMRFDTKIGKWTELGQALSDAGPGEYFGFSVALSADGNRMAVGSPFYQFATGIVHVYDYDAKKNEWGQVGQDLVGPSISNLFGLSLSFAADGSMLAVGASSQGDHFATPGFARLLHLVDDYWQQIGEDILGYKVGDHFGWSVALSSIGDTLAVGGLVGFQDRHGGYVRVVDVKEDRTGWLLATDDLQYKHGTGDWFGFALSMSFNGKVLAVGATGHFSLFIKGEGEVETNSYVQVYERDGSIWREKGSELKAQQESEHFGMALSLDYDGRTLAVGAPLSDKRFKNAGRTQTYGYNEEYSEWVAFGQPILGEVAEALNGWSVVLSENADYMAIGSARESVNGIFQSGQARLYRLPNVGE